MNLKVKKKRKSEWSIVWSLKKLNVIYKPTVTMKELEDTLANTKPYYLNNMGLSVNPDRSDVEKRKPHTCGDYSRTGQLLMESSCMCGKKSAPMGSSSISPTVLVRILI